MNGAPQRVPGGRGRRYQRAADILGGGQKEHGMESVGDFSDIWSELAGPGGRILYLILDGAGGLRDPHSHKTALEAARTPKLDRLTQGSACGVLELVGPGITPGSGPGHLALFGYDPLRFRVGRGVLSALGIGFELREGDVAARVNFATLDARGRVTDRRAGRIASDLNRHLCEKIRQAVQLDFDGEYFLQTVAGHRAALVLRSPGLAAEVQDTDPQRTGVPPLEPEPRTSEAEATARLLGSFIAQVHELLADERPANAVLLRGLQRYQPLPSLAQRFGLEGLCLARYPMYRGLCRLLGMELAPVPTNLTEAFDLFGQRGADRYDFCFLHVKGTDTAGEDADFDRKVAAIEEVDRLLPTLLEHQPDVLVVSADHSTPAAMGGHSWHPVPVLIHARNARADAIEHFDEYRCRSGSLGLRPGVHLMGLALAHAGRLKKFGA
jgi:2,3-bisphosphoglycerate-independent phosphoglycerate mutase